MSDCYARVHRMAYGLTGREDVGRSIVKYIMRRGMKMLPSWLDEGEPFRWCQHHTVLVARRASKHVPDVANDTLVKHAQTDNAYYAAFIRALRALPKQHQEAFILHHGEQFDLRGLAVSMDCSTEAAGNHLKQATTSLTQLGGEYFASFTAQLAHAYRALTPQDDLVLSNVTYNVRRYLWPRKLWNLAKFAVSLAVLAIIAMFVWRYWGKLVY